MLACKNGHLEVAQYLILTKGADVKAKSNVCACESEEIYMMNYTACCFFPDVATLSYAVISIQLSTLNILNNKSFPLHDENDMIMTMFVPDKY